MVQLHSPTRDLEDIEIRQDKFSEGPAQESSSEEHRGLYAICHIPYQSPAFIITVFRRFLHVEYLNLFNSQGKKCF